MPADVDEKRDHGYINVIYVNINVVYSKILLPRAIEKKIVNKLAMI